MYQDSQQDVRNRVVKKYRRLSETYDWRWSRYIEATVRETVARLSLRATSRLLDVGCGTGTLLQSVSATCPEVRLSGIDPVPAMLAVAQDKLPSGVDLCHGWADDLPFASAQFDGVVLCNMFHYLQRPASALREIRRVLRPGGQLVITDWCGDYLTCRALTRYLRVVEGTPHRVYRAQECVRLGQQAGYVPVTVERYRINWFWGIMTICLDNPTG